MKPYLVSRTTLSVRGCADSDMEVFKARARIPRRGLVRGDCGRAWSSESGSEPREVVTIFSGYTTSSRFSNSSKTGAAGPSE